MRDRTGFACGEGEGGLHALAVGDAVYARRRCVPRPRPPGIGCARRRRRREPPPPPRTAAAAALARFNLSLASRAGWFTRGDGEAPPADEQAAEPSSSPPSLAIAGARLAVELRPLDLAATRPPAAWLASAVRAGEPPSARGSAPGSAT
jgi:hypothetical protein